MISSLTLLLPLFFVAAEFCYPDISVKGTTIGKASSGYATVESCLSWCRLKSACTFFVHVAATGACRIGYDEFIGADGTTAAVSGQQAQTCFVRATSTDGGWRSIVGFDVAGTLVSNQTNVATEVACSSACFSNANCTFYSYNSSTKVCMLRKDPISTSDSGTMGVATALTTGFKTSQTTPCQKTCSAERAALFPYDVPPVYAGLAGLYEGGSWDSDSQLWADLSGVSGDAVIRRSGGSGIIKLQDFLNGWCARGCQRACLQRA